MLSCTIENEELLFRSRRRGDWGEPWALPIQQALAGEIDAAQIPDWVRKQKLAVLIVPDYWLGTITLKIEARKQSIVEAFVARKLQAEPGGIPGALDFFAYRFFSSSTGKNRVHVIHMQEPAVLDLYHALEAVELAPMRITSSALLWEVALTESIATFETERAVFLQVLPGECFQYYYDRGRFLFSRNLILSTAVGESQPDFGEIVFEATQSQHLYAQKTRTGVSSFYLLATEESAAPDAEFFSSGLQSKVVSLTEQPALAALGEMTATQVALQFVAGRSGGRIPGLSRRSQERDQFWRPTQRIAIAAGVVMLAVLGLVQLELRSMDAFARSAPPGTGVQTPGERHEGLRELEGALDFLTALEARPEPTWLLAQISAAVPEQMTLVEVEFDLDRPTRVVIKGRISVPNTELLMDRLALFLNTLHERIPASASITLGSVLIDEMNAVENHNDEDPLVAVEMEFQIP